jgi:2-oxoisovalerate dehydrogenase E2 component (dihydrolipoyl transacylase)
MYYLVFLILSHFQWQFQVFGRCEVITDKVTAEVPSSYAGTIREIIVNEGTTVAVAFDVLSCVSDSVSFSVAVSSVWSSASNMQMTSSTATV